MQKTVFFQTVKIENYLVWKENLDKPSPSSNNLGIEVKYKGGFKWVKKKKNEIINQTSTVDRINLTSKSIIVPRTCQALREQINMQINFESTESKTTG